MSTAIGSRPLPAGPKGRPLTGVFHDYQRDPLGFFTRCAREYGDFVPLRFGPVQAFLLNHPDLIDEVLVRNHRAFVKGPALRNNRIVFGDGLLVSEGDLWRRQRRLATPAFRADRIAAYGPTMVECTLRRLAQWQDGEVRDVHAEMMRVTMEIAARTLFGVGVEGREEQVAACMGLLQEGAMRRFNALTRLEEWLPTPTNIRLLMAVWKLNRVVYGFVQEGRRRDANSQHGERADLLSELLAATDEEDGSRMSDRQLRDEVLTLFLAGHETTALALTWTLMLLSENPEVERRLADEVRDALGGDPPTFEDRARLPYTEQVVLEGMRLWPPAWALSRTAVEDCEIGGYPAPRKSLILMLQWVMHRDPRWFDEPERFAPERWEGDLARRLPRGVYFPFGGGPRFCIGSTFAMAEAVLLLATLAQRFRFRLVPDHPIVPQAAITLRPKHGLRMVVSRR